MFPLTHTGPPQAAFSDLDAASDPGLRRDYMRLCHSLDKRQAAEPGLFSRPQRAQLEVYRVLGFTQNEMHTDDSFVFNKVSGAKSFERAVGVQDSR